MACMLALVNPGDEVVIFEPFYENYGPDVILSGATPRFVKLRPPHWGFDPDELAAAFGPRTRAIVVNTPHNPTGHVFTHEELSMIRDLCLRWNVIAITDEIYEHIIYDGAVHIPLASLDGMAGPVRQVREEVTDARLADNPGGRVAAGLHRLDGAKQLGAGIAQLSKQVLAWHD